MPDPRKSPRRDPSSRRPRPNPRPPLKIFTTTLWEYPSQHYDSKFSSMQGSRDYVGATPSWIIWQLLQRYTREKDLVVDPMAGSGTTIDVARELNRRALGYDLVPRRSDVFRADARKLPLEDAVADFVFVDPPYSTHIDYSDDPACIGKLDASGPDSGSAYYTAMTGVISEIHRVLKNRRYCALYVSDSWKKKKNAPANDHARHSTSNAHRPNTEGGFMPIGFTLFNMLCQHFTPIDIIAVVRHNAKLQQGNFHKTAREQNFFLRGFNYLFIMKKTD
ncbi:MAG TPA: DNA methyltransferase [Phycisphaerales bacterium]|nr:DNA methyltransferase [Phycisphaerales bacterium]